MNVNMASGEGTVSLEGTSLGKTRPTRRCVMCDVNLTSAHDRVQHNTSLFHKFMKKRRQKHLSFTKKFRTFDKLLQSPENEEPLLGLEYIYQYIPNNGKDVPYECKLCKLDHWNVNVFTHIVGIKHKTLYLSKHYPMMGIGNDFKAESPQDYTKLQEVAWTVEQNHGRNRINVVNNFLCRRAGTNAKGNSEPDASSEDEQGNQKSSFINPDNTRDRESNLEEIRYGSIGSVNYERTSNRNSRFQPDLPIDRSLHNQYDEHGDLFMRGSYTQKDGESNTFPRMPQRYSPDYQCERDYQPPSHRRMAFNYSDAEGSIVQPGYANAENQRRQNGGSVYERDLQSEWLSYNARDRDRTQNRYAEFPNDRDHHLQTRTASDGYYGNGSNHGVMRGHYTSFRELKAAHKADGNSKYCPENVTDDLEVNYDSDMEVRSMDLSDSDQDTFLCNPELFEYLKTYHIEDGDDERFIVKVCSVFMEASVKHKNRVEDLQKRIADEKLKLEEEKKAFTVAQFKNAKSLLATKDGTAPRQSSVGVREPTPCTNRAFEDQKKMNDPSHKDSKSKKQASGPSSSSKPIFPNTPLNNSGLATMSAPLMPHPPCVYPTVPQSRWLHQSNTMSSEMLQGGWINAQPQRGVLPHGSKTESSTAKH
ncbi:uncharacterized protein [Hyperolius riggenbachi]|uniref:uncharacterized protein isoform X2 n=1 Tax=Hyperolius riggenbachi TaxID=752182 RepID=UPI0035A3A8BB